MKLKKAIIIVALFLAVIAVFVIKTLKDAGEFKNIEPHCACRCTPVNDVPGAEDIAIDAATGLAYVSSFDRRAAVRGEIRQGAIYSYSLKGKPILKNLTEGLDKKFYPHGISLYRHTDGRKYLFAINHRPDGHYVEIFEVTGNGLSHLESVGGDMLISPNDVAGVGPRQFYATNDHGTASGMGRTIEEYLQLSRSTIVYYDGNSFRQVADDFAYANGIALSGDGAILYAASTVGRYVRVFRRNAASGALERIAQVELGTAPDNIDIDPEGRIRVACHPKMLTFVKHSKKSGVNSPSQIIEITGDPKAGYAYREIYLDRGDGISGSSVAASYGDRLLVGSVFENFFLDCIMGK